jgi:hypothetical protein
LENNGKVGLDLEFSKDESMAHDVFISYATENKPIADALCAKMEAKQIRCWIAPRDLPVGVPYGAALVEAIQASRAFVLVLSADANQSQHVPREVEQAVHNCIPLIPFRIENIEPSQSLNYFIKSLHWLDALTPPMEKHLDKLTESVQALLGQKRPEERAPPNRPAAAKGPNRWIFAAACLAVAALGLGLWLSRDLWFPARPNPVKRPDVDPPTAKTDRKFMTTAMLLELIAVDLQTAQNPSGRRYVTLAHLWNDPSIEPELLKEWQDAVAREKSRLGTQLFVPVDSARTVYASDLASECEESFVGDPYALTFDKADLARVLHDVQEKSGSPRPYTRADWFLRQRVQRGRSPTSTTERLVERWRTRGVGLSTAAADLGLPDPSLLVAEVQWNKFLADRSRRRCGIPGGSPDQERLPKKRRCHPQLRAGQRRCQVRAHRGGHRQPAENAAEKGQPERPDPCCPQRSWLSTAQRHGLFLRLWGGAFRQQRHGVR